jgi:hypothetical protein
MLYFAPKKYRYFCQRPGRGCGVVGLDRGAAPDCVPVFAPEEVAVSVDDEYHHKVVDEAAHDGGVDSREEHHPRRDLDCHVVRSRRSLQGQSNSRYSPILSELERYTELVTTLLDQAEKYMLPVCHVSTLGPRNKLARDATDWLFGYYCAGQHLERLSVKMPVPKRE